MGAGGYAGEGLVEGEKGDAMEGEIADEPLAFGLIGLEGYFDAAVTVNRPVEPEQLEALATAVEQTAWSLGPDVQSEQVGLAVLEGLRRLDDVAAVRFASVYKGFEQVDDFAREVGLLNKSADPDAREVVPNQRQSKHGPGFGSER